MAAEALADGSEPVAETAAKALDVFELEAIAKKNLPPAHWGYMATGVDGDATLRANREGFANLALRVRRLAGGKRPTRPSRCWARRGRRRSSSAPVSSQRAFHHDGEIATARAARAKKHLQILSTLASTSVEDVAAARGGPVWFQLYPTDQWPVAQGLMKRAEAAGCPALVLTVDLQGGSNRETVVRAPASRHARLLVVPRGRPVRSSAGFRTRRTFEGLDVSKATWIFPPTRRGTTSTGCATPGHGSSSSRESSRARTRSSASRTARTASSCRTTAGAPRRASARPSTASSRWRRP